MNLQTTALGSLQVFEREYRNGNVISFNLKALTSENLSFGTLQKENKLQNIGVMCDQLPCPYLALKPGQFL